MPRLTVIAGPNGSGKSTLTAALEMDGKDRLIDPDAIAKRMARGSPIEPFSIDAGREAIRLSREYITARVSFAVETTLSSMSTVNLMQRAKAAGFAVDLIYVCVNTPERNVARVASRVAAGGHHVPEADIRRRYGRSLANLPSAIRAADRAKLFDTSGFPASKIAEFLAGEMMWFAPGLAEWAVDAVSSFR